MSSGKRILADFKVFSRGYLRNRFGLVLRIGFPSYFNFDFRRNFLRKQLRNNQRLHAKPRYWTICSTADEHCFTVS